MVGAHHPRCALLASAGTLRPGAIFTVNALKCLATPVYYHSDRVQALAQVSLLKCLSQPQCGLLLLSVEAFGAGASIFGAFATGQFSKGSVGQTLGTAPCTLMCSTACVSWQRV